MNRRDNGKKGNGMTFCERIRENAQSFMRANGFAFKKGIFYRIENDMAFCVNLEMPTGTVYSNCFVLPLYVPTEFCYMTYGTRLTVGAAEGMEARETRRDWPVNGCQYYRMTFSRAFKRSLLPMPFSLR